MHAITDRLEQSDVYTKSNAVQQIENRIESNEQWDQSNPKE